MSESEGLEMGNEKGKGRKFFRLPGLGVLVAVLYVLFWDRLVVGVHDEIGQELMSVIRSSYFDCIFLASTTGIIPP